MIVQWGWWDPITFYAYVLLEASMNMGGWFGGVFIIIWGVCVCEWVIDEGSCGLRMPQAA